MPLGTLINLPLIFIQGFSDQIHIQTSDFNYNMGTSGGPLSIGSNGGIISSSTTEHIRISD